MFKKIAVFFLVILAVAAFSQPLVLSRGPARIDGNLYMHYGDYITNSAAGTLGFGASNLTTTGTITASNVSSITTKLTLVSAGVDLDSLIFDPTTAKWPIMIRQNGVGKFRVDSTGVVTLANNETIDNTTDGTIQEVAGVKKQAFDALAYWTSTVADGGGVTFADVSDGTASFTFSQPVTMAGAVTLGSSTHVGKLIGAGSSGLANAYSVGATAGNTKAMSYYVKSTSVLATDVLEGLYVNAYFGTRPSIAAPSGEAGRFRAYLTGQQSGSVALVGMHSTLEISGSSSGGGLLLGGRENIVLPDTTINVGTAAGAQAELYSGGTNTAFTGLKPAILQLSVGGTVTASNWTTPVIDIEVPAACVSTSGYIVDTDATTGTVAGKIRARINGTDVWIPYCAANN